MAGMMAHCLVHFISRLPLHTSVFNKKATTLYVVENPGFGTRQQALSDQPSAVSSLLPAENQTAPETCEECAR